MPAYNKLILLISYGIPPAGTAVVASICFDTRHPAVRVQIQTFQRTASSAEKRYGSGVRNTNPRRGAFKCSFYFPRIPCHTVCVFTFVFACRLQTPGLQWRYTVSIVANGKKGRDCCCQHPIPRTPPENPRNGSVRAEKGVVIRPWAGKMV